jgi:signal peptidase I
MRTARLVARLLLTLVALAVVVAIVAACFLRKVQSDEMAPTLLPGDLVWVLPLTPTRGDIVQLEDPNDPGRLVLRRVVAEPAQKVRFDEGGLRVNGKRVRQQEPVAVDGIVTAKETIWSKPPARATSWFVQKADREASWKTEPYEVPADSWYVLSDNREWALDSRWWGAIPGGTVKGVVRARIGPKDEHRGPVTWLVGVPED